MTERSGALLVTPQPLGPRMAGPAIRTLELAAGLARDGRSGPVTVASLADVERVRDGIALVAVDREPALRRLLAAAAVAIIQGDVLGLHPWLVDEDVPLVVDAYDPYHLEQLEQARSMAPRERRAVVRDCVRSLNAQLARADLVLCASARQRALWIGHLAALGRINPVTYDRAPDLSALVAVVPFGVPTDPAPARDRSVLTRAFPGVGENDVVLVWGGGLYEWFDPELLVHAVARILPELPAVRLIFLGTQHPVAGVRSAHAAARQAAVDTGTLDRAVFFHEGWVPYDDRGRWLVAADVGVSTHRAHVETEFAFRTRLLDYLWCGLPVVSTGGDDLANSLASRGAGAVVPPGNLDELVGALRTAVADARWREDAAACSAVLGKEFTWDSVVRPLADFCAAPSRAPDLVLDAVDRLQLGLADPRVASPVDRLRAAWREGGPMLLARRSRNRLSSLKRGSRATR